MAGGGRVGKWVKFLFTGEKPRERQSKEKEPEAERPKLPPQTVPVLVPNDKGPGKGALLQGRSVLTKNQREEIRQRMLEGLGEEGLAALEELLAAPRDMKVKCRHCNKSNIVKPPTSDNLRLQVVELLSKYSVGTRHEEEVTERFVLMMNE